MEKVSFNEVVGIWLKREYVRIWKDSVDPFIRQHLSGISIRDFQNIIDIQNYSDNQENFLRFILLYLNREPLLEPCKNAKWYKTSLDAEEFKELRVIRASRWVQISIDESGLCNGKLSDVANNVYNQRQNPFTNEPYRKYYDSMVKNLPLWESTHLLEEIDANLILLQSNDGIRTILEGNKSAMALYIKCFLKQEIEYNPYEVYVGCLDHKCIWQF